MTFAVWGLIAGKDAFRLIDTFGMPFDMLQELLHERHLAFDWAGFCEEAIKANWSIRRLRELAESSFPLGECSPILVNVITYCAEKRSGLNDIR